MVGYNTIDLDRDGAWLTIWLNRPKERNALSSEMVEELLHCLTDAASNQTIRGITLRGRGEVFCAGGDLKLLGASFREKDGGRATINAASQRGGALFQAISDLPQVVVILVEGAAMAGGLGIACAGDIVAVTTEAKFALTETSLGIPPAQIAPFVVARLGMKTAKRLMLTAAKFEGHQAIEIGLADFAGPDMASLEAFEAGIRKSVMRTAPGANAATKALLVQMPGLNAIQMRERAAEVFTECLVGPEGKEGIASFMEKRKPNWAG